MPIKNRGNTPPWSAPSARPHPRMRQLHRANAVGEIAQHVFLGFGDGEMFFQRLDANFFASAAVSTRIKVSAVPPDLEMATKCALRSNRFSAASQKGIDVEIPPANFLQAVSARPPSWSRRSQHRDRLHALDRVRRFAAFRSGSGRNTQQSKHLAAPVRPARPARHRPARIASSQRGAPLPDTARSREKERR